MARSHASRFEAVLDRIEVTAVVDIERDRAQALADLLAGDLRVETDYRNIYDSVDAVLIVVPHHLHHRVTLDCLGAGKHVLVEKPLALNEADCIDMIEAAKRHDRVLMVAYCMRFHPLVVRMKQLLDAKAYGDVFQLSIWTEQLTHADEGHWSRSAQTLGGGQLFSHGCHYIDILLWYLGEPINGIHLGTNVGTPWMEQEGTSNVSIQFEGNRLGYHFGTWGARGSRLHYSFHAHCSEGMIEADITGHRLVAHVGGEQQILLESTAGGKHTENEMAHFLDCIDSRQTPITDGTASLQSLRVIWKLYEAEQRGVVADLRGLGLPSR